MTDRDLLIAYQQHRSPEHFTQLVNTHINLVYSVARRHAKDSHLAEDITQEVFLTLARKAPALKPDIPLAGWLFTTTRLLSLQTLRAASRRNRHESEAAMSHEPPQPPDPTWSLIAEDIDKAVADLSPTDRDALLLRYFSGKSTTEIAAILAISEEAAKKRVQRALNALQKLLTSRGLATTTAITALTLAAALTTHAVQAAPPTLASSITTTLTTKAATTTLATKGTFMAAKFKTALIASAAVVAITASAGTAVLLSKHNAPPLGARAPADTAVLVTADTASQPEGQVTAAASWKGWGIGKYPATSPFQSVRWNGDTPEVQINNTWYQLLSLNDLSADQIITAAKSAAPDWKLRFAEDLPALLAYMGHESGTTVSLQLKNLQNQTTESLTDIPMTEENRKAIHDALTATALHAYQTAPKISPFSAIRWNNDTPEVQINADTTWYQFLSFNDVSADKIINFAKKSDKNWQGRFEEDFVALLILMGHDPGTTATLQLKNLQTNATETFPNIELTKENRDAIYDARHAAQTPP